ncbi:954_t:CDS:2, partial [Gigaspora rosea]
KVLQQGDKPALPMDLTGAINAFKQIPQLNELQLPVLTYEQIQPTESLLHNYFSFNTLLLHFISVPDLPTPEWDILDNYAPHTSVTATHTDHLMDHEENTPIFPLETELQKISLNNNELNIVTHNIRGMSKLGKIHDWIDYCEESNFHIIALTETKLTTIRAANLTNPLYSFFTSNFEPPNQTNTGPSLGTALM